MQFEDKGIYLADISFYQADPRKKQFIDFQKMKGWRDENGNGLSGVIIKAGQRDYFDPAFAVNRAGARAVGLPRAFYWFLDYAKDGKAQAQFFWDLIKDDPGEGPLIVDFEAGSGSWRHHLEDFIVELQQLSKYSADRIWIYTGYYYWMDFGPQTTNEQMWFIPYRLWLAAYTEHVDLVKVPRPWLTATMWQKGTTIAYGPDLGVLSLEIDFDVFNGDRALFNRYFITDYVPDVPQEEEPTGGNEDMQYKVIWSEGVARRKAPHTGTSTEMTYTGLKYLNGATVDVVQDNIPDQLDPNNQHKVWVKFADGYYGASEYPTSAGVPAVRMEKITEPTPAPGPTIVHTIDIYSDGKVALDGGERQ